MKNSKNIQEKTGTRIKESDITKKILQYLADKKHFAFKHWGGMMGRKGVADIIGAQNPTGIAFFLEVKTQTGEPSDEQRDFLFDAQAAGAITGVVRNIDDIINMGL